VESKWVMFPTQQHQQQSSSEKSPIGYLVLQCSICSLARSQESQPSKLVATIWHHNIPLIHDIHQIIDSYILEEE